MNDFGKGPTVLVVDDEPEIRKLVAAILGGLGYSVLTADNGEHALAVQEHLPGKIDLLVADVVATGMSGPVLADKLSMRQPDLKVLFISGYDRSHVVQTYVLERGCHLLSKPFTAAQMAEAAQALVSVASHSSAAGR